MKSFVSLLRKCFNCLMFAYTFLMIGYVGCTFTSHTFKPYNFKEDIHSNKFKPKIDAMIIVLDASISMTEVYLGKEKFQTSILALHNMNASLSYANIKTGFRVIGTGTCHFCEKSKQLFRISPYDPLKLDIKNLQKINPGGESPLEVAILSVGNDIQNIDGRIGVIIISDWKTSPEKIKPAIKKLWKQYSKRIEIYGIVPGSFESINKYYKSDKTMGKYIQFHPVNKLLVYDDLKIFIQNSFLEPIYDSDNDGIINTKDSCDKTPSGALVDKKGCSKDSDNDGIHDGLDRCQKTIKGMPVNENGCFQLPILFFKSNQYHLTREQEKSLLPLIKVLRKNEICLEIQGHADNFGTKENNIDVSNKRAHSVFEYFLSEGLRHYQMRIKPFGSSIPLNKYQASMKNASQRRVEFKVVPCKKNR